ncbi:hypothetical protein, conserved [Trypanosoma brucei gambiense DAL972]|uniref:Steroid 5-alpha reductase C-terminal domain-containing protein n=2 Tax=Trypanosoma brucei TaxID=5691 RepID=C9ZJX6_TRYB9|nr:hypothetical protein, conserved [Trypanosoma brucei gambiense DAL972]CBH09740.1 hypothetical protein, conserved [Trypanosoma brucei gambiense DAL972]|eukprot:XP_011772033.1 hypothetical protein, conserved [Trypanosoma brucei gambiense DAL972]
MAQEGLKEVTDSPYFLKKWLAFIDYAANDLFGGPRPLKAAHVINLQKGGTLFFCLWLMKKSGNYSATAITYTALHGGYGLCWLLKELVFPDPKWQKHITFAGALTIFASVLGPYWYIVYNAIMRKAERSEGALCAATLVYLIGLVMMMCSDCQKYFVLKKKKGLITDGFFSRIRHPNYLGEMMIYGTFGFISNHVGSFGVLAWVWVGLFLPFMIQKEASMSRYSEWRAYKSRTGFLLPSVLPPKQKTTTVE